MRTPQEIADNIAMEIALEGVMKFTGLSHAPTSLEVERAAMIAAIEADRAQRPRTVWTLTVDDEGITTTIHASAKAALDALHDAYAPGEPRGDLQSLLDEYAIVAYIENHETPEGA